MTALSLTAIIGSKSVSSFFVQCRHELSSSLPPEIGTCCGYRLRGNEPSLSYSNYPHPSVSGKTQRFLAKQTPVYKTFLLPTGTFFKKPPRGPIKLIQHLLSIFSNIPFALKSTKNMFQLLFYQLHHITTFRNGIQILTFYYQFIPI